MPYVIISTRTIHGRTRSAPVIRAGWPAIYDTHEAAEAARDRMANGPHDLSPGEIWAPTYRTECLSAMSADDQEYMLGWQDMINSAAARADHL